MYRKLLIVTAILVLCSGEESNEATSYISFHREDAPLAYNFSQVHIYTTENPQEHIQHSEKLRKIQYAPIPLENKEQTFESSLEITDKEENKWSDINNRQRIPIEPHRVQNNVVNEYQQGTKAHISGHNIGLVAPTELRYLHEWDYNRANKNYGPRNIQYTQSGVHNYQNEAITPNFQEGSHNILKDKQNLQLQLASYLLPKSQRLHLNVARTYNIANLPNQAYINAIQSQMKQTQYNQLK